MKEIRLKNEWSMQISQDLNGVKMMRSQWETIQNSRSLPFLSTDIDWYLSVLEAMKDRVQPYVIILCYDGNPKAILIGRKSKTRIKCKIGYLTLLKTSLQSLFIIYRGVLGQPGPDACSIFFEELMHMLDSGEVDVVIFNHLLVDSEMYKFARTKPKVLSRGRFPQVDPHWTMDVPKSIEDFYRTRSGRHRRNLQRYIRKFEECCSGKSKLVKYVNKSEVDDFIKIAADISSKTYQNALGAGIGNNERTKCLITAAAMHGWFRGHILFAGDKACAFQYGLCYERVYYMQSIGYP